MPKIFVVDDNPAQVELAKRVLSYDGNVVEGFCDPFLALSAAIEEKPDLVIVDQVMPMMEGTQLIREMKKAGVTAKFIVMSGFAKVFELSSMQAAGVERCLLKPIRGVELSEAVHTVLAAV